MMRGRLIVVLVALAGLAACADKPVPPDWQGNAKSAMDSAVSSWLTGDARGEAIDFARARSEVGRTGRPDLMARVELMRCAAHVASLDIGPCDGFERLRADAGPDERAYADYLAGKPLPADDIARLPPAQRAAATARTSDQVAQAVVQAQVQAIDDPLSRVIAVAVLFQAGQASPAVIAVAVDTASAQGWRRPLMAWLDVQASLADKAGDADMAARLRRRSALIQAAI